MDASYLELVRSSAAKLRTVRIADSVSCATSLADAKAVWYRSDSCMIVIAYNTANTAITGKVQSATAVSSRDVATMIASPTVVSTT